MKILSNLNERTTHITVIIKFDILKNDRQRIKIPLSV
jgi:hypothetical protein